MHHEKDEMPEEKEKIKLKPKFIQSTHQQVRDTINWYIKKKVPFEYIVQNDNISVSSAKGAYTTRYKQYTIDEINFIKAVKMHIVKNELYAPYIGKKVKPVMYFHYNKRLKPGTTFDRCTNIDLASAYWETANMLGLLPPTLYKQGLTVRKQVRLAAIGSLAKKKKTFVFDGKKQTLKSVQRSELTEVLWDVICNHVADVLIATERAIGKKFIFFWVDGIYVENGAEGLVKKFFEAAGFGWKQNGLKKIEIKDRHIHVYPKELAKGEKKEYKEFPFRNGEVSKSFLGYNRDL
jgi:hypothetical protein